MVEAQSQCVPLKNTFRGPFLLFFCPGTRSCALKDAHSQTLFSFCSTPRPITSLVLIATQATAKIGQAATAWSLGEASWGCTLQEVVNDRCSWAMQ